MACGLWPVGCGGGGSGGGGVSGGVSVDVGCLLFFIDYNIILTYFDCEDTSNNLPFFFMPHADAQVATIYRLE